MDKPGIIPDLHFRRFSPNTKKTSEQIAEKLAYIWCVTWAQEEHFKNRYYQFLFVKPSDLLNAQFNLDREVLVLIDLQRNFEARALDFVDKIMMEDYQNRLDKLCIIVVSNDEDLQKKVQDRVNQDKEIRVIIPYTVSELINMSNEEEFLLKRLREYFYIRDLFDFTTPLKKDTFFFGRSELIHNLYNRYYNGENSGLFGLRKIGKTSALYALERVMKLRKEPVALVQCDNTSFYLKRWNHALAYLIETIATQLCKDKINRLTVSKGYDSYKPDMAGTLFTNDLIKIHNYCDSKRLLIIFDEIENITPLSPASHWKEQKDFIHFWNSLRSVFQQNEKLFSIIITGRNPSCIERAKIDTSDNPLYRFVNSQYVKPFEIPQIRDMITSIGKYMGLSFDEEIYTHLKDDFGGHPLLIRLVCSRLNQIAKGTRPIHIKKYLYAENKELLSQTVWVDVEEILTDLEKSYPEEHALLQHLAIEDTETFNDFAKEIPLCVEHLLGYGIIEKHNGSYYFTIKTIKDYIKGKTKLKKLCLTDEEKWAEINSCRNRLEIDLRKLIEQNLKAKYGTSLAKEKFLNPLRGKKSPADFTKLTTFEMSQLLSKKSTEAVLYLDDLREAIQGNWDCFSVVFGYDKKDFDHYMRKANKYRRPPAHATPFTDEEFNEARFCYSWLQEKVESFLYG